jgi:hypothetical protein
VALLPLPGDGLLDLLLLDLLGDRLLNLLLLDLLDLLGDGLLNLCLLHLLGDGLLYVLGDRVLQVVVLLERVLTELLTRLAELLAELLNRLAELLAELAELLPVLPHLRVEPEPRAVRRADELRAEAGAERIAERGGRVGRRVRSRAHDRFSHRCAGGSPMTHPRAETQRNRNNSESHESSGNTAAAPLGEDTERAVPVTSGLSPAAAPGPGAGVASRRSSGTA